MLEVKNLTVHYDGAMALNNVSIKVDKGEFVAVVGPNGAGKTTLLKAISGTIRELQRVRREKAHLTGEIIFEGKRIDKLKPWSIVKMGIVHCPERRRLFSEMTVYENLIMGSYLRKDKEEVKKDLERVYQLFPVLKERRNQMAQTLSGGEGQMLAIARALMARPKLLMIDEPSLGLSTDSKTNSFRKRTRDMEIRSNNSSSRTGRKHGPKPSHQRIRPNARQNSSSRNTGRTVKE
jgi:branched-chain amino acid transport system ATP-binding protein